MYCFIMHHVGEDQFRPRRIENSKDRQSARIRVVYDRMVLAERAFLAFLGLLEAFYQCNLIVSLLIQCYQWPV